MSKLSTEEQIITLQMITLQITVSSSSFMILIVGVGGHTQLSFP